MRSRTRIDPSTGETHRVHWERSDRCGKLTYATKKIAKAKARVSAKMSGERIEAYHCYPCHGWHIGHPPGSRRGAA